MYVHVTVLLMTLVVALLGLAVVACIGYMWTNKCIMLDLAKAAYMKNQVYMIYMYM